MRITNVIPLLTCPGRNYVFVKIETADGLYGWGEGTLLWSEREVFTRLQEIGPNLIGLDSGRIEDIWQYLYARTYWRGGPIMSSALAAIDIALWDLLGKRCGVPVYQLLGGKSREGVLVYTYAEGSTFEEVEDAARALLAQGYKAVRAQLGEYGSPGLREQSYAGERQRGAVYFNPALYLDSAPQMLEHLRVQLGDEVELLHDVHEKLTPIEACQLAKRLEPYRLFSWRTRCARNIVIAFGCCGSRAPFRSRLAKFTVTAGICCNFFKSSSLITIACHRSIAAA